METLLRRQAALLAEREYETLMWDAKRVAKALNIGQRTLWRWIAAGMFPAPDLSVGGKIRRWKRETVIGWIDANGESK